MDPENGGVQIYWSGASRHSKDLEISFNTFAHPEGEGRQTQ